MDNDKGTQLNQLSRLVFNRAARFWQLSLLVEIITGAIGLTVSLNAPSPNISILWAIIAALLLMSAYGLRIAFEYKYDAAETMRRQSVLSEGLGWDIGESQFREWKSRAGRRILDQFATIRRDQEYYATKQLFGAERLAEMTLESAFWTRNLYKKLRQSFLLIFLPLGLILVFLSLYSVFGDRVQGTAVVYAVYLAVPILISIDLLGIILRTHRAIQNLSDVEKGLDDFIKDKQFDLGKVMRLVSEYNCVVCAGIVIPNWFYRICREQIQRYWSQ